ncbi:capsid assembly protein [Thalassospira lucentensis]|uniref:capsid assembly protein n=1 Tax=Thalassospira lucentensis TaxID=168935 RepID=UPI003D2F4F89
MTTDPDQGEQQKDVASHDLASPPTTPLVNFGLPGADDATGNLDAGVGDSAADGVTDGRVHGASGDDENPSFDITQIPESPDAYALSIDAGLGQADPALNQRLFDAGFSHAQAQLVYDLAGEILNPMMDELDQAAKRATDRADLIAAFGGVENWQKLAPKIESWGRANLPKAAFDAMCQSKDGVTALHRLMGQSQEAKLGRSHDTDANDDVRAEIRRKMNDPRYWRDRDPALVADVQADFASLSRP